MGDKIKDYRSNRFAPQSGLQPQLFIPINTPTGELHATWHHQPQTYGINKFEVYYSYITDTETSISWTTPVTVSSTSTDDSGGGKYMKETDTKVINSQGSVGSDFVMSGQENIHKKILV
ncbi:MAG: hypothetical protein B6242_03225 [Anaerolineaceae bacterium 4572_78]|nr:MAG: hypothetical protein B6242_03225 [Anaerolineaceae bacterium 4572_78]